MATCRDETQAYRQCLKDAKTSGCGASKKCKRIAQTLEDCREKYRKANSIEHVFDGTRILPNHQCQPLNKKVQRCLKWKNGDQSQCQDEIATLKNCMATTSGVVAPPTEGDKIWSDYKGKKWIKVVWLGMSGFFYANISIICDRKVSEGGPSIE